MSSSVSRRAFLGLVGVGSVAAVAGGGLLIDQGLDGENDILQALGLEPKPEGVRDFIADPPVKGVDTGKVVVEGSPVVDPDLPAQEAAQQVLAAQEGVVSGSEGGYTPGGPSAMDDSVDTSRISQGGGLGPQDSSFSWDSMRPLELSIPEANLAIPIVNAPVVPTNVPNRVEMQVPSSYYAGWLVSSAPLGSSTGVSTVAGHVNFTNGYWAPMSNLYNVRPGMVIRTTDAEGNLIRWKATNTRTVPQVELSKYFSVEDLEGPRKLLLLTCKSALNGQGQWVFTDNFIVEAVPE